MKKLVSGLFLFLTAAACGSPPVPNAPPPPASAQPGQPLSLPPAGANVSFALAAAPPVSLTASDGTGLRLAKLDAEAVVDGPLAFTEMRMTFENPQNRTLEGTFRLALPQGASLGRFAMKIGEEWQEGEVVELAAARQAYEDFLHRKQDPALMEKAAGNEFSARVFPIPARAKKEIVVSYVTELGESPYVLPLRGLPELGELRAKVDVIGAKTQPGPLAARDTTPGNDLVVDPKALGVVTKSDGVRSGDLAIVRVRPQATSKPDPLANAIVLVDTSASRALGFKDEIAVVDKLVKRIGDGAVTVACFDQTIAPIFEGKGSAFGAAELAKIEERGPLGASDMERALKWAQDKAKKSGAKRVVLVTDGVSTAGSTDAKKLGAQASALRDAGVERLDAVAVGGIRDDVGLQGLVRGKLAHDGVVAKAEDGPDTIARRLGEATRSGIAVKIDGANWSWPSRLDGVQAGDSYAVYAEVGEGKPVKVSVDGAAAQVVDLRATSRPLVERAVMQAKVASMLERETTSKEDMKKSIISIAVQNRIMTPYTAMLVLETEDDYARFHIDRKSLVDVLAIQDGSVKRVHRTYHQPPMIATSHDADGDTDPSFADDLKKADKSESKPRRPGERRLDEAPAAKAEPPKPSTPRSPGAAGGATAVNRPPPAATATAAAPPADAPPPPPPPPPAQAARSIDGRALGNAQMAARPAPQAEESSHPKVNPYEGKLATVMSQLASGKKSEALASARAWRAEDAGDVLALIALGEASEANAQTETAARAYGSIVDLFPNRADLRRFAGERLERLGDGGLDLAIDTFEKARADRPDHPASHRLLAYALLKKKECRKALEVAIAGSRRGYEVDRFMGVDRILREDVGLIGAACAKQDPAHAGEILAQVRAGGGAIENQPSVRFVLNWETDANDVDFHIHDAKGGHAFYGSKVLPSGGELYADVTTGYGPECFTIRLPKARRVSPYKLEAHYYSRGPMGYGMGKLQIIEHDGNGGLTFEERPFVIMADNAFVDLGTVK
jgi:hypothetical protein